MYNFEICFSLAKEEELVAAKNKTEELEKENTTIAAELAKKEQELDLRNQEKVTAHFSYYFFILILNVYFIYFRKIWKPVF